MVRMISALVLTGLFSVAASAQPTSITYQGQLKDGGVPANGNYNMVFKLFSASSGGTQVGPTITRNGVALSNGLFNQTLDFGTTAFTGERRWIEIAANGTLLSPRQEITAVPYALSVPGLSTSEAGVEVTGDIHTPGEVIASAFSSNSPLIFKVNPANVECARIEDETCFLGLGTDIPTARLHIGGTPGVDGIRFPDGSLQTTAAGVGAGGFWSANGTHIFNNNGGNVGIGAADPQAKLEVRGGEVRFPGGTNPISAATHFNWSGDGRNYIRGATILGDTGNNVSIGTSHTHLAKLHVFDAGSVTQRIESGGGTNAWSRVEFTNGNGQWHIGTSREFNHDVFYFDRPGNSALEFQMSTWGGLGLGIEPQAKLHLYEPVNSVSHRIQTGGGTNSWSRVEFTNGDGQWNVGTSRNFIGNQFYFQRQGSPNIALGIFPNGDATLQGSMSCNSLNATSANVQGTMTCKVLAVTGADVAEKFPSTDDKVEPGTVMEIDPDHPGKLRVAREAYSSRVAGVVSGAGDNPAGAVLGNIPGSENSPAIALSGRVWVRCDATEAAITAGDLLTTSQSRGLAMKASNRERSHGAVLGKAMTPLAQGERGLVLVLVNLQ